LKETNVSVVRHRRRRPGRKSAATKFLVALLFAATAAITWQFARQQPASSMSHVRPEFKGIKLNEPDASPRPTVHIPRSWIRAQYAGVSAFGDSGWNVTPKSCGRPWSTIR
jgi:hypothetical protein